MGGGPERVECWVEERKVRKYILFINHKHGEPPKERERERVIFTSVSSPETDTKRKIKKKVFLFEF